MALRIRVNLERTAQDLTELKEELTDFSPLWRIFRDRWTSEAFHRVFRTDGLGTWAETRRPNPILRDTLALLRSYTEANASGNISEITSKRFVWGSNIEYAGIHERGLGIVARPVAGLVIIDPVSNRRLEQLTEDYVEQIIAARNRRG